MKQRKPQVPETSGREQKLSNNYNTQVGVVRWGKVMSERDRNYMQGGQGQKWGWSVMPQY